MNCCNAGPFSIVRSTIQVSLQFSVLGAEISTNSNMELAGAWAKQELLLVLHVMRFMVLKSLNYRVLGR